MKKVVSCFKWASSLSRKFMAAWDQAAIKEEKIRKLKSEHYTKYGRELWRGLL